MNRLEDAEKRFTAALRLMQSAESEGVDPKDAKDDIGGILVGLGLVKDRLGDAEGAVSVLQAAVTHYRKVYGEDGSTLIAKALTSLGRCKELIDKLDEAGGHFEEVSTHDPGSGQSIREIKLNLSTLTGRTNFRQAGGQRPAPGRSAGTPRKKSTEETNVQVCNRVVVLGGGAGGAKGCA